MNDINACIATLRKQYPAILIKEGEPLALHTTFGIGGPCDLWIEPEDGRQLSEVLTLLRGRQMPTVLLGNGSNVLVSDKGIRGAVVCMNRLNRVTVEGERIIAEAGARLSAVAQRALEAGLAGMEFAGGIPGTVGGAVFMNAGAYDGQMADLVQRTVYYDAQANECTIEGADHGFGYRTSVFRANEDWTIVQTVLELKAGEKDAIRAKMDDFAQRRRDKQPLNFHSAGSTFKRPEGYFAGSLIEQAGLKGTSVGAAQVSEKHAGFLINRGGASCADMRALIALVQKRVFEQFGVQLSCEVRFLGEE